MRVSSAAKVLVVVGTIALTKASMFLQQVSDPTTIDYEFAKFIAQYGKSYETKEEYLARRGIFEEQFIMVQNQNSQNGATYKVGINKFSDLSDAEFAAHYLGDSGAPEGEPMQN